MLRRCPAHGALDEAWCPTCGHRGDPLLDEEHRTRLSKFLSGALRHFPDDVGLDVDARGWTSQAELIEAALDRYPWATAEHVRAVLSTDPKGRFETREDRVRATYGHSIDVRVDKDEGSIPDRLYHGTAAANRGVILSEGLQPMGRREVHLSGEVETAREVGRRHADEIAVLGVDVEGLREEGIEIQRRSEDVYTCERVPPEHLEVLHVDR